MVAVAITLPGLYDFYWSIELFNHENRKETNQQQKNKLARRSSDHLLGDLKDLFTKTVKVLITESHLQG